MNFRLQAIVGTVLLAAVAVVVYYPALHGALVLDDDLLITKNYLIKAPDGLYRFWLTKEAPDYWPLTSTTWWIEWRLWGANRGPLLISAISSRLKAPASSGAFFST